MPDVLVDNELIDDANSASSAVRGIYSVNRHMDIGAFMGDLELRAGLITLWPFKNTGGLKENNVRPELNILEDYYVAEYKVINQANSVLKQLETQTSIPGLSKEKQDHYKGVALFFRANSHLNLLRTFGEFYNPGSKYGICYIDFPVRQDNDKIARHSVSDTFKKIYADLDTAIELLEARDPAVPQEVGGEVYKHAALALKARALLANSQYAEAAAAAQKAIQAATEAGVILEPDYLAGFVKKSSSNEIIFSLNAIYPEMSMLFIYPRTYSPKVAEMAHSLVSNPEFVDPSFNGEEPIYHLIFSDEYTSKIGTIYMTKSNKVFPTTFTMGDEQSPYFGIRLAELYYIAAESYADQGQTDKAIEALKPVLGRVGYTDAYWAYLKANPGELRQRIMYHKHIEFLTENSEPYYDDIRLHGTKKINIVALKLLANADRLALPIPRAAIAGNNLLEQNPGYKD